MPTIPDPASLSRLRFQPSEGVASYRGDQVGAATAQLGDVIGQGGGHVANMAMLQRDHIARNQAKDALLNLQLAKTELIFGDEGHKNDVGGAVLAPDYTKRRMEKFTSAGQTHGAALTPEARSYYDQGVKELQRNYHADLLQHQMGEMDKYEEQVYNNGITVNSILAAKNHTNPLEVQNNVLAARTASAARSFRLKESGDVAEVRRRAAVGSVHSAVAEAFINADMPDEAAEYVKSVKDDLHPKQEEQLNNMIRPLSAYTKAAKFNQELLQMQVNGVSEPEILAKRRELTAGSGPEVDRHLDRMLRENEEAIKAQRTEEEGSILLRYWKGEAGSGFNDPALRALDKVKPGRGAAVREQLEHVRRIKESKVESVTDYNSIRLYYELAARATTQDLTENEVMANAKTLGGGNVKSLLLAIVGGNVAARKAAIPPALIAAGMPASADTAEEKAAARGFIYRKHNDWKDANPGKIATDEEMAAIVRSASEEHIKVGKYWLVNGTEAAYKTAEAQDTYPKTFEQLLPAASDEVRLKAFQYYRRVNSSRPKGAPPITEQEGIEAWLSTQNKKR